MAKQYESIMIKLRGQGLTYGQIAARLRVTERFVRTFFGSSQPTPAAKPNGNRTIYKRAALEMVLRQKEREAAAIANSITSLREQIEQLSILEASRQSLQQAIKGGR